MSVQINKTQESFIPFFDIKKNNLACLEIFEKNSNVTRNKKTKYTSTINSGIIINCIPNIGDITQQKSNFFINNTSYLNKNKKNVESIVFGNNFEANSTKQIFEQKILSSVYNDKSIDPNNTLNILTSNLNNKATYVKNLYNSFLKKDFIFEKSFSQSINPYFNENVSNTISPSSYPSVIKILNNEFEKSVLSLDDPLSNYLIYSLQYPLNHISHINFNEGIHLEPFSLSNIIQFKTKQEYEFNRFYCDINNAKNSRNESINFSYTFNTKEKNIESKFFDNFNIRKDSFLLKKSVDNNKKSNILTSSSYIFLKEDNSIKPFNDNNKNIIYTTDNYHDISFKTIFKNNRIFENIINSTSNIYYEKNDKFYSCGFDWSYTNSLGKNSIAFKGLE